MPRVATPLDHNAPWYIKWRTSGLCNVLVSFPARQTRSYCTLLLIITQRLRVSTTLSKQLVLKFPGVFVSAHPLQCWFRPDQFISCNIERGDGELKIAVLARVC
jgi:hypothetical protein